MKRNKIILLLFVFIAVFSTQFFNNIKWKQITGGFDVYYYVVYPIIMVSALPCMISRKYKHEYSREVTAIFLISFLFLITVFVRGGSISMDLDLPPILFSMAILSYFILYRYKVSEKSLLLCLTYVELFVFLIQIFQQLNPSSAVFGINDPNKASFSSDVAATRNNLYRFLLPTSQLSLVCLFYWWSRFLEKRSSGAVVLFICFAISIYLYLTRQVIFSSVIVLAITPLLLTSRKTNKKVKMMTLLFIIIMFAFAPAIFGELFEMTKEGGDSTENRLTSYLFFGSKIIESPFTFLFGNGTPPETIVWHEAELNASDIGIVGEVSHKGIFAFVLYLALLYKLLIKNKTETPLFVKLYVLSTFINIIMAFPYIQGYEYFLWAILLYISEGRNTCPNNKIILGHDESA